MTYARRLLCNNTYFFFYVNIPYTLYAVCKSRYALCDMRCHQHSLCDVQCDRHSLCCFRSNLHPVCHASYHQHSLCDVQCERHSCCFLLTYTLYAMYTATYSLCDLQCERHSCCFVLTYTLYAMHTATYSLYVMCRVRVGVVLTAVWTLLLSPMATAMTGLPLVKTVMEAWSVLVWRRCGW